MKKKQYFCISLCILASTLFYWSCTDSEFGSTNAPIQHKEFSLQEAREFFEQQMEQCPMPNRSAKGQKHKQVSPGDFVPKWGQSVASSLKHLSSYDVPIQAGFRYKAMRSDYKNGKASAYIVDVYQKLIIVKDTETDALGQYILTLIPDRSYHARYKKEVGERFINCADKGRFSGIAIYTIPHLDIVIRANRYVNGVKTRGVFLPNKNQTLKQKLKVLESILKGTVLKRRAVYSTRSFGEDDWDFGIENEDFWAVGDDLFYDPDNDSWFIDFDGDGYPDSAYIPEFEVTPDDPWEDPFPDPDPDPDSDNTGEDVCPYCGSPSCFGDCQDTGSSGGTGETELSKKTRAIKNKLDEIFNDAINDIKNDVTIIEGDTESGRLAEQKISGSLNDILYKDMPITLVINSSLDEAQLKLVMMHEYVHLEYLEISRDAGSRNEFYKANSELYNDIVHSEVTTDWGKINDGHHQYMGGHIEDIEDLLREAFPNENEDFYEYGKWGGGATDSPEFEELTDEEQRNIIQYLRNNNL